MRTLAVPSAWLLALSLVGCAGDAPTAPSPNLPVPPSTTGVVTLVSPVNGGYVQQNDPATGCRYDPVMGYGFTVTFEWSGVDGGGTYDLELKHRYGSVPLLSTRLQGTRYRYLACGIVADDANGMWQWKVRAVGSDGREADWSAPFYLNFTPCTLENGRHCAEQPGG